MCFADRGFVFLSMPKAGSTVLQKHFARHAMILFRQPPGMKHMSAVTFEATMAPWLARYGHPRETYVTMCLVRHPLDRAVSWWRYRSRPEAQGQPNWTGGMGLAEFADRLVSGEVSLGTSSNFVTDNDGAVIVDRMYRYEHLAEATAWMAERLGIAAPVLEPTNVSPVRQGEMDAATRARLEEHFADDLAIYEQAL
jgi:Sulfotransferase family